MTNNKQESFASVAALAHVAWGGWMVYLAHEFLTLGWAVTLATLIAVAKECAEGLGIATWEERTPWSSSIRDIEWFVVGIGISFVILAFRGY